MQYDLFDNLPNTSVEDWNPGPPPQIRSKGIREVFMDFETTGLKWWDGDLPVGAGVCLPDGTTSYTAWGHYGGGNNITPENARQWMKDEFAGVRITNLNTRFDIHMGYAFGVDFEALGCEVSDVSHYAALLDDHRQRFSLEALVNDMLEDDEAKVKAVNGVALDGRRMAHYHAGLVAVRAEADARQVWKLKNLMWPMLDEQGLQRVRELEDRVIYVVCEMERNGAIIDLELLEQWRKQCKNEFLKIALELTKIVGGKRVDPTKRNDQQRIFNHFKLPLERTSMGVASFTDSILKRHEQENENEQARYAIGLLRRAVRLASLDSKFLTKYVKAVDSKGILRYSLHQLRAEKDDYSPGATGTVSGRFSSTAITDDTGVNIQQVIKAAKQRVSFGYDENDSSHDDEIYVIRALHKAAQGDFLSSDAMQIEYRIFASETRSERLIAAYADDLNRLKRGEEPLSFHKFMHATLKPFAPNLTYRRQKDLNFAKIYGAGLKKMALMLGFVTQEQYEMLVRIKARGDHPLLAETANIGKIYNREIPEVEPLLKRASHLARTECDDWCRKDDELHRSGLPHRGYIKTILGRRARFPGGRQSHKALNRRIQGSAADIMKQKLVELHDAREYTQFKLRYTVHDEVDGDALTPETAERVSEVLNAQSFSDSVRVPILWEVSTGKTWRDCA